MNLSKSSRALWAKLSRDEDNQWLPLYIHMSDADQMAKILWHNWVPFGTKKIIGSPLEAERLFRFLAAVHDLGKATPAFQLGKKYGAMGFEAAKERVLNSGLPDKFLSSPRAIHHSRASQIIAESEPYEMPRELAVIIGGHHGIPPLASEINKAAAYKSNLGLDDKKWRDVQTELFFYAASLTQISISELKTLEISVPAQMILTGLVIMTDWIVSSEKLFPYIDDTRPYLLPPSKRAWQAWDNLGLPPYWEALDEETLAGFDLYTERFCITPRPMQTAVAEEMLSAESPGIVVIEAPMGEGKTEAALVSAEILAAKTGRSGVFFALPTQATSDGIFPRMLDWINQLGQDAPRTINLAHGKSRLNEDYKGIRNPSPNVGEDGNWENVIIHDWFEGRKKGILADFVVGTIDQLLMGGLKQKHLALRHLGLTNKIVVIDECHAYDAYMNSYLYKVLNWLGAYKTPVVILSATLPSETRRHLIEAYLDRNFAPKQEALPWLGINEQVAPLPPWAASRAYPAVTYSDGQKVSFLEIPASGRNLTVQVTTLSEEALLTTLDELLSEGGCAGIVVNTVRRAQEITRLLTSHFGEPTVQLLHARLIAPERIKRERNLREQLGKNAEKRPHQLIVVGTQIMEQSLDVDFDLLITDICPMDLLLQRMGRLQRHERPRPPKLQKAKCFIIGIEEAGFEKGAEFIYGKYLLMNAQQLLRDEINLPDDIPNLVQAAYSKEGLGILTEEYAKAKAEHENHKKEKATKAKAFQIIKPGDCLMNNLLGLLDTSITQDPHGKRAEATVRDTGDSIEVLVIQRRDDGNYYTLPYLDDFSGVLIPRELPSRELADAIARCSLKLPTSFSAVWNIEKTITELENNNLKNLPAAWQDSYWLKDELFLILDENFEAELAGYQLNYDEKYGLITRKAGE